MIPSFDIRIKTNFTWDLPVWSLGIPEVFRGSVPFPTNLNWDLPCWSLLCWFVFFCKAHVNWYMHTYTITWVVFGEVVVQLWCSFGAVLVQFWCSFGAVLEGVMIYHQRQYEGWENKNIFTASLLGTSLLETNVCVLNSTVSSLLVALWQSSLHYIMTLYIRM